MITSVSNNLIKLAASLNQKKYRQQHGLFLLEGVRAVGDAFFLNRNLIEHIFLTEDFYNSYAEKKLIKSLLPTDFTLVTGEVMQKICDTVTPSGIAAIAKIPQNQSEICNLGNYVLYLDRISDPGNLGTIVRTALAAGYGIILDNCADMFSPKTVRSSMSAVLRIKFAYANEDALQKLSADGYKIIGADAGGEDLFSCKINPPICVIIGNEAEGISKKALAGCDKILSIPMESIESLNASVAAAVMMYRLKFN